MATCLLAAMISATNSFQSPKVSPDTLELASELIIHGAKREKIVESLYRTKDIDTLKSWGKVLSRLRKKDSIISSYLEYDELDNLPQDFETMVRELILASPGAQVALIFYPLEFHKTEVWIYTIANINALDLTKGLEASGHRYLAKISLDKDIEEAREEIIGQLQERLRLINSF
jgi:nanoRNase/pAp phosphatase (c-di-AMP/oligoRNAs hydrolase)